LLGYLRPYRTRLAAALLCMVVYAAMSGVSLGLVAPFMKVLFEPAATSHATVTTPAATPLPAPSRMGLTGWPQPLRGWLERALLDARPLVQLERICVFIVIVLLLKNVADYLQAFL